MVRLDTPPDAIDKVYAKALFELAYEQGGRERLEELCAELDELLELARSIPGLEEFLASKIISFERKEKSMRRMFEGRISPEILHLALLLHRKGRPGRVGRVGVAFDQMVQEKFGRIEVDVYTRFPMPAEQLEQLREMLRGALGREPVVYTYTDASMIGGLRIQIGDWLIDASFSTRLRKMRDLLNDKGGASIKAHFDRIVEDKQDYEKPPA